MICAIVVWRAIDVLIPPIDAPWNNMDKDTTQLKQEHSADTVATVSCRVEMVTFQFSGSFPAFFPQPFYGRNRISSIRTGPEIRQGIVLFASDRPGSIRGTSKLC
ncbi:hypothetical protein TNCV_2946132 [Trichonephila clavipes]|nr:hypothetical protein TNCV_2946132 [Trichonephila clavipes]